MPATRSGTQPNDHAGAEGYVIDTFHSINVPKANLNTSDTNKSASKRALFLIKLASMTHHLRWHFTEVAFDNALSVFTVAMKAHMNPLVVENLENDEGVFIDFTSEGLYYAFELYNDGEIILTKKIGDQNAVVDTVDSIEQITF